MQKNFDSILMSGKKIWFDAPELTDIDLDDIGNNLINICRYSGNVPCKLSSHSFLVGRLAFIGALQKGYTIDDAIIQKGYGISHDFTEAILGDVITPVKANLPWFKTTEELWDRYLHNHLGLPIQYRDNSLIHWADKRALFLETWYWNHPLHQELIPFSEQMSQEEKTLTRDVFSLTPEDSWISCLNGFKKAKYILNEKIEEQLNSAQQELIHE